jgi:hypothetical protein
MSETVPVIIIILLAAALLLLVLRRLRAGAQYRLRPLASYTTMRQQVGRAAESGRQLHMSPGRAPLPEANSPTSVAALEVLSYLARESGESGIAPKVTLGEATLLPAAQGSVFRAQAASKVPVDLHPDDVQFIAASDFPLSYAAGVTNVIHHDEIAGNVAIGRFSSEIALIAEAAHRGEHEQILGSDDPTAIALATLYTDQALWGEEIFAAGAYLEGRMDQLASVRAQDILRWLVAGSIFLVVLLRIAGLI